MEYILLSCAVLLGVSKNVFTKIVKKKSEDFYDMMKMNVITFSIALITVFLIGIASIKTTFYVPWLLVIGYAVCMFSAQIALMKAVELGSVSLSSLFYSCGFILPTLFGGIYYKEVINALHIIGIALIIVAFVFSTKKSEDKKFNFGWLIAALAGMFFAGMLGILQKIFTNEYAQYKLDNFLCVAFVFMILMSAVAMFIARLKKEKKERKDEPAAETVKTSMLIKQYGFTVLLGVVLGLGNKCNTYLTGVLPSVILFPIMNGGIIFITTLSSMILFKEKLSFVQKIGLLIGFLAIACITVAKVV